MYTRSTQFVATVGSAASFAVSFVLALDEVYIEALIKILVLCCRLDILLVHEVARNKHLSIVHNLLGRHQCDFPDKSFGKALLDLGATISTWTQHCPFNC